MKARRKSIYILLLVLAFFVGLSFLLKNTYSTNNGLVPQFISGNIAELNSVLETKRDVKDPYVLFEILDDNNNVPAYDYYTDLPSRSIKELKAYDDKIFMGLGDWTNNTGPVKIIYYDTVSEKIGTSGTIVDEAVESFHIIDGSLYTTGTDPRKSWGYGSYYVYNKEINQWEEHEFNGGWKHIFNIVKFNDKFFMCGSVDTAEKTPIQYSTDGGVTFQNVKIFKDGEQLVHDGSLRFYNFVIYDNTLYAYAYFSNDTYNYSGIYKYDEENNQFNYWYKIGYSKMEYGLMESVRYNLIHFNNNTVFNDYFVYVSGNFMYKTKDLVKYTKLMTDTTDVVQDVVVNGDTLYTLSYQYMDDKTFDVRIYSTKDLEMFDMVYEFSIDSFPFSIEYFENSLYIGTAYAEESKDINQTGSLYRVNLDKFKKYLTLDEENQKIDVVASGISYPVSYSFTDDDFKFEVLLTFDNNMSQKQWEQEFTKFENLNLMYTLVDNKRNIDLELSTSYFNDVLYNNLDNQSNSYSNALEFAEDMFSEELNIVDEKFNITTKNVSSTDDKYEVLVTLSVINIDDTVTSEKYIVNDEDGYIYIGTDTDIDIIDDNIVTAKNINVDVDLNNNKILIKFNENILKEYTIVRINTSRKIIDEYMYVGDMTTDELLSDVTAINAEAFVENNKLKIVKNDSTIVEFELLFVDFGEFNVSNKIITILDVITYNEFVANIKVSSGIRYEMFVDGTEMVNGNIKTGIIKIYYNEEEIDFFDITADYLEFDESVVVDENNKYLSNINLNNSAIDMLTKINTNGIVTLVNKDGEELIDAHLIGTGTKVTVKLSTKIYEYSVVIGGDIDGDGKLALSDIMKMTNYIYSDKSSLTGVYLRAADYDQNNLYNLQDVMKVAKKLYKGGN